MHRLVPPDRSRRRVLAILGPFVVIAAVVAVSLAARSGGGSAAPAFSPKELASDKWMGLPGAKDTGVLRTLQAQADFLKAAEQMSAIPPTFAPYVDASFLAKMI